MYIFLLKSIIRGLGNAKPVTQERGPYRLLGHATPVTQERDPTELGVMPNRSRRSVTSERDPTGFRAMPSRSRGSVTRSESASCEFPQLTSSCFGTVYSSMAE